MDRPQRAIRVPADNCPECLGDKTSAREARFYASSAGYPDSPCIRVHYGCPCGNTWVTAWATEFIA